MLGSKLKLGDIDDVESFCKLQINVYLVKFNMKLNPDAYEDLMSYTFLAIWILWNEKYDGTGSFSGYASYILPKRITDYLRQQWGREGQKMAIHNAIPFSAFRTNSDNTENEKLDLVNYNNGVYSMVN